MADNSPDRKKKKNPEEFRVHFCIPGAPVEEVLPDAPLCGSTWFTTEAVTVSPRALRLLQ
jgi:hypothetical protein